MKIPEGSSIFSNRVSAIQRLEQELQNSDSQVINNAVKHQVATSICSICSRAVSSSDIKSAQSMSSKEVAPTAAVSSIDLSTMTSLQLNTLALGDITQYKMIANKCIIKGLNLPPWLNKYKDKTYQKLHNKLLSLTAQLTTIIKDLKAKTNLSPSSQKLLTLYTNTVSAFNTFSQSDTNYPTDSTNFKNFWNNPLGNGKSMDTLILGWQMPPAATDPSPVNQYSKIQDYINNLLNQGNFTMNDYQTIFSLTMIMSRQEQAEPHLTTIIDSLFGNGSFTGNIAPFMATFLYLKNGSDKSKTVDEVNTLLDYYPQGGSANKGYNKVYQTIKDIPAGINSGSFQLNYAKELLPNELTPLLNAFQSFFGTPPQPT
jgi:hypothetical protein